ncbi:MAG: hypothetical protein Q8M97_05925 [Methanobacteriaceae archaeon]|nr:hypothetical protein [Methanobacteriaceae archaeon]
MPPTRGAKALYSKATIAAPIKVIIKAVIGQITMRYKAPIEAIEPETEFTTAVVLLSNAIR